MKTSATNRRLRLLMTAIRDKTLVPRPEFQRRLVWTNRHKEEFLKTVLMDYPFPEIYIAAGAVDPETGEGSEMLVDGQQRITTLFQYFTGSQDLLLRDTRPYNELNHDEKIAFLEYEVVIRDLGKKTIEEIKEVFRRINSTKYSLNAMEIHNARFDGELKKFAEELAQDAFFNDNNVFRTTDVRRMGDIVFCLTVVITVLGGYFNRDDELEDFLSRYNDEFTASDDLKASLATVFRFITLCDFDARSRVWRKADLLTLLVELYFALFTKKISLEPEVTGEALKKFYETVDAVRDEDATGKDATEYYKAALQGTNDRTNRVRRGAIIASILESTASVTGGSGGAASRWRS